MQGQELNIVLLIGIAIFLGTVGAKIFQRFHIPQIIGYIVVGIILGPPLLNIITPKTVESFEFFNFFALGIIGFLIGGELKRDLFLKFGKQVFSILLFEGLIAFLLVGGLSFCVMLLFSDWQTAVAVSIVFGAICAATDPASTVNVLWEYKTRGPITTMLIAVVALDDALALVLYMTSVSIASFITGHQEVGPAKMLLHTLYEIFGSLGLGVAMGLVLREVIIRIDDTEKTLVFAISTIILTIGLALTFGLDVILSSMALGVTLVNIAPRQSRKSFDLIHKFAPPIYVLFFVIIGARLNVASINTQILILAVVYIVGSIIGKTVGSYWGSCYSNAAVTVRKYLGFCLYQQGTIAIALLIMASTRFEGQIRDVMLSVIIIGVFVLQLLGPLSLKMGLKKAGEVGMNITEEDLIKTYNVDDVMDKDVPVISSGMYLSEVIQVVSTTDNFYYSVVDSEKNLIGAVTLDGIRNTFTSQELNDWLVALDITEPIIASVTPETALSDALEQTRKLDIEHIPVINSKEDNKLTGVLSCRKVRRSLSAEVLSRQKKADDMHSAQNL